jgi:MFS family permease
MYSKGEVDMTPRGKKKGLQAGNILAMSITIGINALAVILPLNGKTTEYLSDKYPNLFVPAGITFSIWGIIYILWVVFAVYQARDLFKKEEQNMPFLGHITFLFILSCIANSAWIFAWHYEYVGISLLLMIVLLFSLLAIYMRLNIGRSGASRAEKLCVQVPFSVYLGWITIATIANVTAFLVSVHWDGFGISQINWTIVVIGVGVLITVLMLALRKDIAYSLVVLWALLGIWIKRTTPGFENSDVATTAIIAMILIGVAIIAVIGYQLQKRKKPTQENPPVVST